MREENREGDFYFHVYVLAVVLARRILINDLIFLFGSPSLNFVINRLMIHLLNQLFVYQVVRKVQQIISSNQ